MQPIEYDKIGRMKYHPDFHKNQGKRFTPEENAYLCYWYGKDTVRDIGFALERTEVSISIRVGQMKKSGDFEYYRKLWKYMERIH